MILDLSDTETQHLIAFLQRVDLKGSESTAHAILLQKIQQAIQQQPVAVAQDNGSAPMGVKA